MHLRTFIYLIFTMVIVACKEEKTQKAAPESIETTTEKVVTSTYEDLEGNPVELSDYKGKRVVLNYWATWCRPCIEEMPDMEKAQAILADEGYVFLFASDQSIDTINKFKETRGFNLDYIKFNGVYAKINVSALPATFVYNEVGEQVLRFDGGLKWDSPEMIEKLKAVQ